MAAYRNLDGIRELRSAGIVPFGGDVAPLVAALTDRFRLQCRVFRPEEFLENQGTLQPDVLFLGPDEDPRHGAASRYCRRLRAHGYQGGVLLVVETRGRPISTSEITGAGFDNYLVTGDDADAWQDSMHWGLINRRRRNKYIIQFDGSPDSFCMLDRRGFVYEINATAAENSGYTPREIVTGAIPAAGIPSLKRSVKVILPLIGEENVDRLYIHTVNEGKAVYQLKTKIHNVPTIGLVATVLKTDITETIYTRTLDILINSLRMLSERDQYTAGHSARVLLYCMQIVENMGRGGNRRLKTQIYHAALLHDIGKVGVRDSILLKPGRLTDEEYLSLATHPVKGYKILRHFEFLKDSLDLIRYHHERPDGKGYPDKLKGSKIPLGAAIIAVADGFDAMTTNRPYRNSLGFKEAIREIEENAGTQYNAVVARAFLAHMTPLLHEEIKRRTLRPLEVIAQDVFSGI